MRKKTLGYYFDKIVRITFRDHVNNSENNSSLICIAYGKVIKETSIDLTIVCWELPKEDAETKHSNEERFTILKSTIENINILR